MGCDGLAENQPGKTKPASFEIFLPKQKFVRTEIKVSDVEYWKKRLEGISHETLINEMNLNKKKSITEEDMQEIKRINDIYEDEVRVI